MKLPSQVASLEEWVELAHAAKLTDGLPVLPPTVEAVEERVRASGRPAGDVLGPIPPRGGIATVEVLAANAAMAGCPPEGMPILVAAVEALLEPRFNLNGVQCTDRKSTR
ncbi:MAG: hypothetical protein ACQGVC_14275, partial [Myxococcota bacterium]